MKVKEVNQSFFAIRSRPRGSPGDGGVLEIWSLTTDLPGSQGELLQSVSFPEGEEICSYAWSQNTAHFVVVTNREIVLFDMVRDGWKTSLTRSQTRRGSNADEDEEEEEDELLNPLRFVDEIRTSQKVSILAKLEHRRQRQRERERERRERAPNGGEEDHLLINKRPLSVETHESLYFFEEMRCVRVTKSLSVQYLAFSFPMLFLHSEEETIVMNILSTVYQRVVLDSGRVMHVSTVAGNVLSWDGKYLAICDVPERASTLSDIGDRNVCLQVRDASSDDGAGEVLKIFDLSQLLFPPKLASSEEIEYKFECKTLTAELEEGDLVTGLHWRPTAGKRDSDMLAVIFQTGCVVVYEVFQERDGEDDDIVEKAIRAALAAGVVDQQQLPRRVNRFLPQIMLVKAMHAPSFLSALSPVPSLAQEEERDRGRERHPLRTLFAWVRDKSALVQQCDAEDEHSFLALSAAAQSHSQFLSVHAVAKSTTTSTAAAKHMQSLSNHANELWLWMAVFPDREDSDADPVLGHSALLRLSPSRARSLSPTPSASASSASLQSLAHQHVHYEIDADSQFVTTQRFHATAREIHAVEAVARFFPSSAMRGHGQRPLPVALQLLAKQDSALGHTVLSRAELLLHTHTRTMRTEAFRMYFFDATNYAAKNTNKLIAADAAEEVAKTKSRITERVSAMPLGDALLLLHPTSSLRENEAHSEKEEEKGPEKKATTNSSIIDPEKELRERESRAAAADLAASQSLRAVCGEMSLCASSLTFAAESYQSGREQQQWLSLLRESVHKGTVQLLSISPQRLVAGCHKGGSTLVLFLLQTRSLAASRHHIGSSRKNKDSSNKNSEEKEVDDSNKSFSAPDSPPSVTVYTVDIVPDLHFGLGLRLDQSSEVQTHNQIVVTSFKKHPITKEAMAAELSGLVQLGDELVAINDKSFYRQPLSSVIPAIRTLLNSLTVGQSVTLKFSRDNNASSPTGTAGSAAPPVIAPHSPVASAHNTELLETADSGRCHSSSSAVSHVSSCEKFYTLPSFETRSVREVLCGGLCVGYTMLSSHCTAGVVLLVCLQQKRDHSLRVKTLHLPLTPTQREGESVWLFSDGLCTVIGEHTLPRSSSSLSSSSFTAVFNVQRKLSCERDVYTHVISVSVAERSSPSLPSISPSIFVLREKRDAPWRFFPLTEKLLSAVSASEAHTQIATSAGVSFLKAFAMMRANVFAETDASNMPSQPSSPRPLSLKNPATLSHSHTLTTMPVDSIRFEDDALSLFASVISPFSTHVAEKLHDILEKVLQCAPRGIGARDLSLLREGEREDDVDPSDNNFYSSSHGQRRVSMTVCSPTLQEREAALDWGALCVRLRDDNAFLRMSFYLQDKLDTFLRGNATQFLLRYLYEMHDLLPLSSPSMRVQHLRFCVTVGDQLTTRSGLLGLFFVVHSTRRALDIALSCDPDLVRRSLTSSALVTATTPSNSKNMSNAEGESETQALAAVLEQFLRLCALDRFAQSSIWQSLLQSCWVDLVDNAAATLQQIKPDLFAKKKVIVAKRDNDEDDDDGDEEEDFSLDYNKSLNKNAALEPPNHTVVSAIQAANMAFSASQEQLFDAFLGCVYAKEDVVEQDLSKQFTIRFGLQSFNHAPKRPTDKEREEEAGEKEANRERKASSAVPPQWDTNTLTAIDILAYATNCKVAFWLHDLGPLVDLILRHSLRKFKTHKSSMQIFLEMALVGKTDTLLQLAKGDKDSTGKQLLKLLLMVDETVNPANDKPDKLQTLQTKLRKNAFALIKRHKYREAAATFLLCPSASMVRSAASVLSQQYDDPLLAHLVTRIFEYRFVTQQQQQQDPDVGFSSAKSTYSLSIPLFEESGSFLERCPFVLGAFSGEVVEKDILPQLLRVVNDAEVSHFQGNFGFSAAIFALLCGLWLQDKTIIRSTFDAVFPLITQFLQESESDEEMLEESSKEHGMLLSCVAQGVKNRYDRKQVSTIFHFLESSVANPYVFHRFSELSASLSFLLDYAQFFLSRSTAAKVRDAIEHFLLRHRQHEHHLQFVRELDRLQRVKHAENPFFAFALRWREKGQLVKNNARQSAERERAAAAEKKRREEEEEQERTRLASLSTPVESEKKISFNFSTMKKVSTAPTRSMLDDDFPPAAPVARTTSTANRPQRSMLDDDLPPAAPAMRPTARPQRSMLDDDFPPAPVRTTARLPKSMLDDDLPPIAVSRPQRSTLDDDFPLAAPVRMTTRPQKSMLDDDLPPSVSRPIVSSNATAPASVSSGTVSLKENTEKEPDVPAEQEKKISFNFSTLKTTSATPTRSMLDDDLPPTVSRPPQSMLDDDFPPAAPVRTTTRPQRNMLGDDVPVTRTTTSKLQRNVFDDDFALSVSRPTVSSPPVASSPPELSSGINATKENNSQEQVGAVAAEQEKKVSFNFLQKDSAAPTRNMLDDDSSQPVSRLTIPSTLTAPVSSGIAPSKTHNQQSSSSSDPLTSVKASEDSHVNSDKYVLNTAQNQEAPAAPNVVIPEKETERATSNNDTQSQSKETKVAVTTNALPLPPLPVFSSVQSKVEDKEKKEAAKRESAARAAPIVAKSPPIDEMEKEKQRKNAERVDATKHNPVPAPAPVSSPVVKAHAPHPTNPFALPMRAPATEIFTPDRASFRSSAASSSYSSSSSSAAHAMPSYITPARPTFRDAPRDSSQSSAHGGSAHGRGTPSNPFSLSSRPAAAAAVNVENIEQRVTNFYRKHNPAKLAEVPVILAKYKGREGELLSKLQKQYQVPSI